MKHYISNGDPLFLSFFFLLFATSDDFTTFPPVYGPQREEHSYGTRMLTS